MDRGAWLAAVHRVAQSRLKWLSLHACIGEGNGNPLQYSCLENPGDGGAWWAAVYGVTQSRTRLKRLSRQIKNINCQTSNEKLEVWKHFNADFLLFDGEMKRHEASLAGWVGSDWGPERPAEELGLDLRLLRSHCFKRTSDRICWVHSSITQSGPTTRAQGTVFKATTE